MRTREFPELCGERRCVETTITVLQRAVGGERRTSLEERRSRAWRLLRMRMPGGSFLGSCGDWSPQPSFLLFLTGPFLAPTPSQNCLSPLGHAPLGSVLCLIVASSP